MNNIFWHSVVVAFAVVCALIMVFNIGIPNAMRGFLFYIQVIGFVYDYDIITWVKELLSHSLKKVIIASYDVYLQDYHLSSVFGFSFYIPLCPYPGYDAPTTAAFGIILPIVAIFMIVLYIVR